MTDKKAQQIICAVAESDPGYALAAKEYADLLPASPVLPDGFAADLVELLRQEPETAEVVAFYEKNGDELQRFGAGTIVTAAVVLTASLFLLGTHIKFELDKDGKKYLKIEHKPADSQLMIKVVDALSKIFRKTP